MTSLKGMAYEARFGVWEGDMGGNSCTLKGVILSHDNFA